MQGGASSSKDVQLSDNASANAGPPAIYVAGYLSKQARTPRLVYCSHLLSVVLGSALGEH